MEDGASGHRGLVPVGGTDEKFALGAPGLAGMTALRADELLRSAQREEVAGAVFLEAEALLKLQEILGEIFERPEKATLY